MATRSLAVDNSWAMTGVFLTITGLVGGLIVLFATGGACTFVTSIMLLAAILLVIVGWFIFLFGTISQRRKRSRFEKPLNQ
ncbi:MAG: hypothetical protein V1771_00530 [Chloroflexota bacterium]